MSDKFIQWPSAKYWDKCYNPVIGCKDISEACQNCYARAIVKRFNINGGNFEPVRMDGAHIPRSGVIFVGNMTDLFGDWNDFDRILLWLLGITLSNNVIPLVLTKRAARMRMFTEYAAGNICKYMTKFWWGITAENQERYNERVIELLECWEIKHRWLSLEPLLGPINFKLSRIGSVGPVGNNIDWVVVGHESGPNRRPGNLDDVRSIVKQCIAAGVPVFVKQLDLGGRDVEKDINKFPEDLRIRQTPWITINFRIEL